MISHGIMNRALMLFRGTLPIDTGNLRYNATYGTYFNSGFALIIDGEKAPYFEYLDGTGKSDQYANLNGFQDESFAPVFGFLKTELKGVFGGGRFIKEKDVLKYTSDLHRTVETMSSMNLSARDRVAGRYRG
jgi:hypothetical protein